MPKFNFDSGIENYKTRFIAKSYSLKEEINYEGTFLPIIKMNTIKLVISVVLSTFGIYISWMLINLF